jgi:single-strand DNA-binding protein
MQGRLVADPELRATQSDISVCNFTLAWSEKYKEIEKKCFLRCVAWRSTAEFVSKWFSKGQEIVVSGKLISRDFTDLNGVKRNVIECEVEEVHFCGNKSKNETSQDSAVTSINFEDVTNSDLGELPF